jgi:hypothetical protein
MAPPRIAYRRCSRHGLAGIHQILFFDIPYLFECLLAGGMILVYSQRLGEIVAETIGREIDTTERKRPATLLID